VRQKEQYLYQPESTSGGLRFIEEVHSHRVGIGQMMPKGNNGTRSPLSQVKKRGKIIGNVVIRLPSIGRKISLF